MLVSAHERDLERQITPREILDEVKTTVLAGHETTGLGLAWTFYALAQNPGVLNRLREELDACLCGRAPTLDDLPALPYLDQVIHEVLRVYPPIWTIISDSIEDDEIGGYHIPAKSSMFVSPFVTHRHPEFWPNPEAFDPENFAEDAPRRHKLAFLPFGGGVRKCIGFQTALLQMRVIVALFVQHFDMQVISGQSISRGNTISLRPSAGIRLVVKPRGYTSFTRQVSPRPIPAPEPEVSATVSSCPFHAGAR